MGRSRKKLWIGQIVFAFLSPLGIILPEKFAAGMPGERTGSIVYILAKVNSRREK